jgi:hypothetical protein
MEILVVAGPIYYFITRRVRIKLMPHSPSTTTPLSPSPNTGEYINNTVHDEIIGKLKVRKTASAASAARPHVGAAGTSSSTGSTGLKASATTTTTTVELTGVGADIPTEYTLEEKTTGSDMRMLAFGEVASSSSGSNAGYVLHGTVTKSMILRPQGAGT